MASKSLRHIWTMAPYAICSLAFEAETSCSVTRTSTADGDWATGAAESVDIGSAAAAMATASRAVRMKTLFGIGILRAPDTQSRALGSGSRQVGHLAWSDARADGSHVPTSTAGGDRGEKPEGAESLSRHPRLRVRRPGRTGRARPLPRGGTVE
jgi:hypothetical protein